MLQGEKVVLNLSDSYTNFRQKYFNHIKKLKKEREAKLEELIKKKDVV